MKKSVYLDYAAATPIDKKVLSAMQPYLSEQFFNPSALYLAGRGVRKAINDAREKIARELAVRTSEIIFTAGGSEANNLAIRGVMDQFPGKKMLISGIEHESVRALAEIYETKVIKVDSHGLIVEEDLKKQLDDDTVLVSIIYSSNEVGTIQDLKEIARIIYEEKLSRKKRGVKTPLYFHTDATQAVSFLNISPKFLGVDLMTINGGKIYGPKQSGALFVRSGTILKPLIYGGGQEKNMRSGTENVPGIIGLSVALEAARGLAKSEGTRLEKLRKELRVELEKLPVEIVFHGHPEKRLPNHLSFAVVGFDNERLMMELDELGFMVAMGSACSASNAEVSHVLLSIGVSKEVAQSTLRVTLGRQTTIKDIRAFTQALASLVSKDVVEQHADRGKH